jgi:hypothetical protein
VSKARVGRITAGSAMPFSEACLNVQLLTRLLLLECHSDKERASCIPTDHFEKKKPSKTRPF